MLMNRVVLQDALDKWGVYMQKLMLIEEMSELTKEIVKSIRGRSNRVEILDEVCDVSIMLEEAKIIWNLTDAELEEHINFKPNRIQERIDRDFIQD
jgi:hypothetical protein